MEAGSLTAEIDKGEFKRQKDQFRNWVTADGVSGYQAVPGRYHLYVSLACPWAHRVVIVRYLKKLQEDLANQRSIMPPDEFTELEGNFRKRVEGLQQMVAERNQLLEEILSKSVQVIQLEAIKIITDIGKEKGLALTLDTSTVVIAANSINISNSVIELLNINLPEVDMNAILNKE